MLSQLACFWGVMKLDPAQDAPRFWRWKGLVKERWQSG
jgi:hypothetical protein